MYTHGKVNVDEIRRPSTMSPGCIQACPDTRGLTSHPQLSQP